MTAPGGEHPTTFRFVSRQSFRWSDVDSFGIVNNAVYFSLFEQARYEYCRALQILRAGQVGFVLGETSARYLRPGKLGMPILVHARTTRLGSKSFAMEYAVHADAERLVLGSATLVWVDERLESAQIPLEVRRAISAHEGIPERSSER